MFGPSPDGAPFVLSGPTTIFPAPASSLVVDSPVREGELAAIVVDGQPGDLVVLLASAQNGSLLVPHYSGWLNVGVPFALVQLLGVVPGGGQLAGAAAIPELPPGLDTFELRLQCLLSPDLVEAALSSWTPLVMLDDTF